MQAPLQALVISDPTSIAKLPVTKSRGRGNKRADYGAHLFRNVQLENCRESFKELFSFYYNPLLFFARKYVEELESAEEVVDDVFLKIWSKRKGIVLKGSFQSYLYSSIRNKCIDHIRKQNGTTFESPDVLAYVESSHSNALEIIQCKDLYDKIERSINQLPTDRRRIFIMSRTEGLMYKEIAAKLNISIKTVETQMGRSLKFLREELKEELREFYGA